MSPGEKGSLRASVWMGFSGMRTGLGGYLSVTLAEGRDFPRHEENCNPQPEDLYKGFTTPVGQAGNRWHAFSIK